MITSQTWAIENHIYAQRADHYLQQKVGRISRTKAQRLVSNGSFRLNGNLISPSQILFSGQMVTLFRPAPDEPSIIENYRVNILYENDAFLVINKPPGLATHPTARDLHQTLTYWLRVNYPGQAPRPCHRLDRETSGIMVCAKTKKADSQIKKGFMQGDVQKKYMAIVTGHLQKSLVINRPLKLQGDRGLVRIRMIEDHNGSNSKTIVQPVAFNPNKNRSLVECIPKTGRQHQIRAHLALEGFPIVGDKLYQMGDTYFDAYTKNKHNQAALEHNRHALHASEIQFIFNSSHFLFKAPIAPDLKQLI